MRKYGTDAFIIEAVESGIPEEKLNEREIHWIAELSPQYNMTKGGDGGDCGRSAKWREANKRHHENRSRESYATYGMKGKKQSQKFKDAIKKANSKPVVVEGKEFASMREAMKALGWSEKKVRHRVGSSKYPDCYRLEASTFPIRDSGGVR